MTTLDARVRILRRVANTENTPEAWSEYALMLERTYGVEAEVKETEISTNVFDNLLLGSIEDYVKTMECEVKLKSFKKAILEKIKRAQLGDDWPGIEFDVGLQKYRLYIANDDLALDVFLRSQERWTRIDSRGVWKDYADKAWKFLVDQEESV